MAPECTDEEIGKFAAALARKIPAPRTERPKGMKWLPAEGMVRGSGRYIKGPLAAQNESPFLEQPFWGFAAAGETDATEAYSAKYGVPPAVSKLVLVKLKKGQAADLLEDSVRAVFEQHLTDVRGGAGLVEARSRDGRSFQFKARGRIAALSRLETALANASR